MLSTLLLLAGLISKCQAVVRVDLESSWPSPPPIIEILESVSLENSSAFFPFLNLVLNNPLIHPNDAINIAHSNQFLTDPGAAQLLDLNLGLHAATPKIQAFYQYYDDHFNSTPCSPWVDWYGQVVCDIDTLLNLTTPSSPRPNVLPFDHIYPPPSLSPSRPHHTAILYASLPSNNFLQFHNHLFHLASNPSPHIEYVLRYIPPRLNTLKPNYLSGYGVALDIKKMDYLAVDDRFRSSNSTTKTSHVNVQDDDPILNLISSFPQNKTAPPLHSPLSPDEIQALGPKSILLLLSSPSPLQTLTHLSQNFPKYTSLLSRLLPSSKSLTHITNQLHFNQDLVQEGTNMLWVNGALLQEKDVYPWGLMRVLKRERGVVMGLVRAGLQGGAMAVDLLTHPNITATQTAKDVLEGLFDASDRLEGGSVIVWWNDIERDSRYAKWSPSLYSILHPLFPGQLPNVKRNLFNVVLVLDFSKVWSWQFVAGPVAAIVRRGYPLRFGVVPVVPGAGDGTRLARLFYHLIHQHGRKKTLDFINHVSQSHSLKQDSNTNIQTKIDWSLIHSSFEALLHNSDSDSDSVAEEAEAESPSQFNLEDILSGNTAFHQPPLDQARAYVERLVGTGAGTTPGDAFINGKHFDLDDDFVRQMQVEIGRQMQFFQELVYEGKITDDTKDIETYFYDQPSTSQRRNRHVYPTEGNGKGTDLRILDVGEVFERTGLGFGMGFVCPEGTQRVLLSMYVVVDLDTRDGLGFVGEALRYLMRNPDDCRTRISFIHNPSTEPVRVQEGKRTPASWYISHLLMSGRLSATSASDLMRALGIGIESESESESTLDETIGNSSEEYLRACMLLVKEMGVSPGQQAVLVNGRVVGPMDPGAFSAADFEALEAYEVKKRAGPVSVALEDVVPGLRGYDRESYAHLVSVASSVIWAVQLRDPSEFSLLDAPVRPRQRAYRRMRSEYTMFELGDNKTALYHVAVVLDPLSETAQRWSSLLEWLLNVPDVFVEVHLNPAQYTDIPLKRFYRYNLQRNVHYNENLEEDISLAEFKNLPIEPIYTLAMDVPSSWLVRPREARYDLDNIQLGHLSPDHPIVHARFQLDYLVIEGHARQINNNAPPRGLQLELVRAGGSIPVDDTQVVANLGYFQFKAKPGVFELGIRRGRGREVFRMESVGNEGWDSPRVEEVGREITLTSFEGLTLFPRLARVKGMEMVDVLQEEKGAQEGVVGGVFGGIASRVTSLFKPRESAIASSEEQAEINIFTVASGLLYERFVSIMILSVLRNTKSTVKFWFIENFLSPSFLEFMPHFAEAYNFKYELVTYKWPSWLRAQTEKQRIIWAYKILFLDVLFPMDLKKVIFVDADQIVRADLKELVDLDLHGAPYGYTPMGDDNTEMEGFRFWKTGYWKEFLQGRPYHISALYVVDLVRFRQLAAGDLLRGQYHGLSADPNSLANLDQDLPNNLQRDVPIFSLHEDWLWCETWCSKDRLHRAKTIDLCQNPLTKEPKLARARKIPEWEAYDAEIAHFARKLAEEGVIRSDVAAADANVLANEGALPQGSSTQVSASATGESSSMPIEDLLDQLRDEL